MCEYSGKLIAWLDRELPDEEATNVEWHVGQCAECRRAAKAYEEVSGAFLACYEAGCYEASCCETALAQASRRSSHWAPMIVGAAAAILLVVVLWPRRAERLPLHPPPAVSAPAMAFQLPSVQTVTVRTRHAAIPLRTRSQQTWIVQEPTVRVALPADALFPPGAVPPGFSFIADVRP